ncbi:MAG: tetratricopeptide repeat protein [Verrucomicrobia bacterium]|nr:MAG: tetratricopeptide repeat protein [Verrucomicrobiota bacterium]
MKWLPYLILAVLVVGSLLFYRCSVQEQTRISEKITQLQQQEGSDDDNQREMLKLQDDADSRGSQNIFVGILLTLLGAGVLGVLFVTLVLPMLAHRVAHLAYDSGEMLEKDAMHDARSLVAQGEYEKAIEALRIAAAHDPLNRLPWVEMARIQRVQLDDVEAAIQTLRQALESQEWQVNDATYFLFRLAELYDEDRQDRVTAASIMQQVIDEFPETRHSANARHKLHTWGLV